MTSSWFTPFGEVIPLLLPGFWVTIKVIFVGFLIGFIIGSFLGIIRLSNKKSFLYGIATVYVEVIRGTPILVQILFIYYGFSSIDINFSAMTAAIIAISINSSAYISEIVRGAIHSIEKGQTEAGLSIGLSNSQTMRYVIWPQALRRMIPPLGNQFIINLKDSALFSVIALGEIVYLGQQYEATTFNTFQSYISISLYYLVITIPFSLILRKYERSTDLND